MANIPILLALSLLTASAPQEAQTPRFESARFTPATILEEPAPPRAVTSVIAPSEPATTRLEAVGAEASNEKDEGLTWGSLAHHLGGALVGGWLGYVGAQVVKSDWDKKTNSSFRDQRSTWAAAGAVVGVISSTFFGTTRSPSKMDIPMTPGPSDGSYIGEAEIRESQARDAYELIYNTRMQWLVTRGVNSVAESPRGQGSGDFNIRVTPGRETIIVYMDDIRLGGVEEMRDISTDVLTSAQFLDTRQATLRYGGGHAHGAILLSTEVRRN
jgi:hypothetical protein